MQGTGAVCMWEEQGVAKEPLPTTHDAQNGRSCTSREKSGTWSSLEASARQHVCLGICLRHRWRVVFKMLYTETESLIGEKHKDNNMEKH